MLVGLQLFLLRVVFVIGGHRLFAESLPTAAGLVMTEIHKDYPGDTTFPEYDRSRWRESGSRAMPSPT